MCLILLLQVECPIFANVFFESAQYKDGQSAPAAGSLQAGGTFEKMKNEITKNKKI